MNDVIRVLYVATGDDELGRSLDAQHATLNVRIAADLREAMDCLDTESIDCIVARQNFSGGTGIDFLKAVRAEFPELPFVFFIDECSNELVQALAGDRTAVLPRVEDEAAAMSLLADRVVTVVQKQRSDRRKDELERITDVIRSLNQALVYARSRVDIDRQVCEIISGSDPYRFAWMGEHNPDEQRVLPRASAGVEEDYLEEITITTDEAPTAQGPTGKAVQTHEIQVMQNIPGIPPMSHGVSRHQNVAINQAPQSRWSTTKRFTAC
ncbi:response regulator [Natrialba swarupiae]|nr:response regulator [Natrialba swarupiae]